VAGNNVYVLAHDTTGKESLDSRHQIKEGNVDDSGEKKREQRRGGNDLR
jgi:hypothetical protein